MTAYTTTHSQELYEAAQRVIPGGVNSGARGPEAGWVPGPPVVARGRGDDLSQCDTRLVDPTRLRQRDEPRILDE